ncbi:MAG: L-threonylcarbamoyladenylate synthase [Pseudomonadota bacterium]
MEHLGPKDIERAAAILRTGGLVAFPTETVYGLGASAFDGRAVAKIYEAKGRPSFNPLILHVASLDQAHALAALSETALRLADAFWPGPMTLVCPNPAPEISNLTTAGLGSVALRMPDLKLARDLIAAAGVPLAAPSANRSGKISPTRADHVIADLNGRIDAVLDGGPTTVGLESTILDTTDDKITCLRPGGLALEKVSALLGYEVEIAKPLDPDSPSSPGQLQSHYAPKVAVRLNADSAAEAEFLLGFGTTVEADLNLSRDADLEEAAANLFAHLHDLDHLAHRTGKMGIAVSPIPEMGLGLAINDRLRRAAAPR